MTAPQRAGGIEVVTRELVTHLSQKRLFNGAAVLHGTSELETNQFEALGLRPPKAMVTWGVSLPPAMAERSGKSDPKIALFVGRIYPVKGLPLLIKAWASVRPAGWKLRIVGPDEAGHRAEVEALVRQTGLASTVEFTGELTGRAKTAAYDSADLFILPSYTENFGMAIAEALAHALPVLTTTAAPWPLLPERGCGWWVTANVEAIAGALSTATTLDVESLQAMGKKGRELVANDFRGTGDRKVPRTRGQECPRYVAHAFQPIRFGRLSSRPSLTRFLSHPLSLARGVRRATPQGSL